MSRPPAIGELTTPDGGHMRTAVWTERAPLRGSLLLLHGRNEFIEKYGELAGELTGIGWRLFSFDWRGQGLSSRFLRLRQPGYVRRFEVYLDDMQHYLAQVFAAAADGPRVLLGHSLGGHVALRYLAERAHDFRAAAFVNPMTGLRRREMPEWAARAFVRCAVLLGQQARYAPGQRDFRPDSPPPFDGNPLTGDAARFAAAIRHRIERPDLALGGATLGWLDAAYRSIDRLWRAPLERIDIPTLILSSPQDVVVDATTHTRLAARLPRSVLHRYPGGRHELLMESDSIRRRVMADLVAFLDGQAPCSAESLTAAALDK